MDTLEARERAAFLLKTQEAVRNCRTQSKKSAAAFADQFPYVTQRMVESWEAGKTLPPVHVRVFLVKEGFLDEKLDVRVNPTEERLGELIVRLRQHEKYQAKLDAMFESTRESWKRVLDLLHS